MEVAKVERTMQNVQAAQQRNVTGAAPLASVPAMRRDHIRAGRKLEELTFGGPSPYARNPRVEKLYNGFEYLIGREGVAPMQTQGAPVETQHHGCVGMSQHPVDFGESQTS